MVSLADRFFATGQIHTLQALHCHTSPALPPHGGKKSNLIGSPTTLIWIKVAREAEFACVVALAQTRTGAGDYASKRYGSLPVHRLSMIWG